MNEKKSLDSEYFKDVYEANDDPWNFETSEYEAEKYAATILSLPRKHYENVLEIGCSIGVLTQLLAQKSTQLLAIDVSEKALNLAAKRCEKLSNTTFKKMNFPEELPDESYDLMMISEVAYYLSASDWQFAIFGLYERLLPEGNVVLVHWLPVVHDYPQTGDEVHNSFEKLMKDKMTNVFSTRAENYRIDVWAKS
ncbi:Ubiquinone biosynthesis O-methyltransferase [Chryseobacterium aquaeductus]|uniref:Ubiquinone biosynthesis O-methyltransferase n=1 Tax=Chryseobacterium aquaeductus TaxID=2675056 RepID=A0A9N8MJE1_9FLAO|nr:SAM-dependent methyltransferase [Chryseobacterium aquaeductus]CAA7331896.1 Ubiquinone biosynthesis O-methyltransferase [Chryseobacterium potabilaquae]CAD7813136.1 Ubiquinone biosynthesis O-methyltransferase [Chryseobacterium aquaeductus]